MSAILAYFSSKFGCHGNSLYNLKNSYSIFEFTIPIDPTIHAKNPRFRRLAMCIDLIVDLIDLID